MLHGHDAGRSGRDKVKPGVARRSEGEFEEVRGLLRNPGPWEMWAEMIVEDQLDRGNIAIRSRKGSCRGLCGVANIEKHGSISCIYNNEYW
jgi:hypothetical protein